MSQPLVFAVFIDYDNLLPVQKAAGILDVVTKALIQLSLDEGITRAKCDVRVYGGWYEGSEITRLAQNVTIEITRDFPTIIRLPIANEEYLKVTANAEIAVALIKEPGHHLFNTLRRRERPGNIRVEEPDNVGCEDLDCVLPLMKRLINKGKCPKANCEVAAGKLIYRQEQKIVDTMLTCDLIHAANGNTHKIILVSSDDDFLPPLRTIVLSGTEAIRFHPKQNNQRVAFPRGGAQLLEMDL